MPTNIEIKARIATMERVRQQAHRRATSPVSHLEQCDVFFHVPFGRLKLRSFPSGPAELIAYHRPDIQGPKASNYRIVEVTNPSEMRALLAGALGELGTITKRRELIMIDQTRVHLDDVSDLGTFMELEVVLGDNDTHERGLQIAHELMKYFEIPPDDLIDCAYIDLLLRHRS